MGTKFLYTLFFVHLGANYNLWLVGKSVLIKGILIV